MRTSRASWLAGMSGFTFAAGCGSAALAQPLVTLKVGAGAIESHAEAAYALANGFFKQHGLDVQLQTLRNGAGIAAAVVGGDLQIGVSSVLQLTQARGKQLPFVIITPGAVHDGRLVHTTNLVVAPDSPIRSAKDLNGKVVAVSTLNGLDQLIVEALVDKSGGDVTTLKFVEIAPAAAADAVLAGRVAAAQLEEPELSAATGVRRLGDGEDAIAPRFATTGWFTTDAWLAQNRDLARRFSTAIFAAGAWAMQNPEKAALVLQQTLGFKTTRATQIFATTRDAREMQPLISAAVKYGLAAPIESTALVWDGR